MRITKVHPFNYPPRVLRSQLLLVELGLVIGKGGRNISEAEADKHIAGYGDYSKLALIKTLTTERCKIALSIDVTARNLQNEVKKKGLPWSAVKGFDTFTPIRCGLSLLRGNYSHF